MSVQTLDTTKLAKLHALMTRGATDGERQAATRKAEALARSAGLTLAAALSRLDAPPQSARPNPFMDFSAWMEAKEPGWTAEQARHRAEREAKRLARCELLLAEYGSEKAVFAATPTERTLRRALAPLREDWHGMDSFKGWVARNPTPAMWEAMKATVPFPDALAGVWAELLGWEKLVDDRCAFDPEYDAPAHVRARQAALEHLMDRLPCPGIEGLRLRLDWMAHLQAREVSRNIDDDKALAVAMRADLDAMAVVQTGQPSRADMRAQVLALLHGAECLSDREIARRAGCSPQTVGNIRRGTSQ